MVRETDWWWRKYELKDRGHRTQMDVSAPSPALPAYQHPKYDTAGAQFLEFSHCSFPKKGDSGCTSCIFSTVFIFYSSLLNKIVIL